MLRAKPRQHRDKWQIRKKKQKSETHLTASFYPSTQFWNLSFPRRWRTCCPLNPDSIHRLFSPAPPSLSFVRSFALFAASLSFPLVRCVALESWRRLRLRLRLRRLGPPLCPVSAASSQHGLCSGAAAWKLEQRNRALSGVRTLILMNIYFVFTVKWYSDYLSHTVL